MVPVTSPVPPGLTAKERAKSLLRRPPVASHPEPGAGTGAVGQGGVVAVALAGHVHLGQVRADRESCRATAGVAPRPQPGSGGRVVGHRAVFAEIRFALHVAGHEHPVTARAHYRPAVVGGAPRAPALHPQLGAVGSVTSSDSLSCTITCPGA